MSVSVVEQARELARAGNPEQARALLVQAVEADRTDAPAWALLAELTADPAERERCLRNCISAAQLNDSEAGREAAAWAAAQLNAPHTASAAQPAAPSQAEPPAAAGSQGEPPRDSKSKTPWIIGGVVVAVLLLVACIAILGLGALNSGRQAAEESTQVAMIAATEAAAPTETPLPTDTPIPTETPEPTATEPPPTATPTEDPFCSPAAVDAYLSEMRGLVEAWNDTADLALASTQLTISPSIADLQAIRRDTRGLDHPECADYVHDLVIGSMDATIETMMAYMAGLDVEVYGPMAETAIEYWTVAGEQLDAFQDDPLAAHEAWVAAEQELAQGAYQPPQGWVDYRIPLSLLTVSAPAGWSYSLAGENDSAFQLANAGQTAGVTGAILTDYLNEFENASDTTRLDMLRSLLRASGYVDYTELDAEMTTAGDNKVYLVGFSARFETGGPVATSMWTIVMPPDGPPVLIAMFTDQTALSEEDAEDIEEIFHSIRMAPVGLGGDLS